MEYLDEYLIENKIKRVNLFTKNPIAMSLYEKFGFKKINLTISKDGKESQVFSKIY